MQHELLEPLSSSRLAECHAKVPDSYPDPGKKLQLTPDGWQEIANNGFVLPVDEWTIDDFEGRNNPDTQDKYAPLYTAENPMSPEAMENWTRMGLRYDAQTGLPIHPRAEQLLTTPGLGMFTQVGSFYRPGPNPVVNSSLARIRNGIVEFASVGVLRDAGKKDGDDPAGKEKKVHWGVPGGFFDPESDPSLTEGAFRETKEEAGVRAGNIGGLVLRRYDDEPQYTWAATVNAWMQESYFCMHSETNPALEGYEELVPEDQEEIVATAWLSRVAMSNPELNFMGTHLSMIWQHEDVLRTQHGELFR